jgi:tripartite-type tricarboxylate transporter receptor subunit TctC
LPQRAQGLRARFAERGACSILALSITAGTIVPALLRWSLAIALVCAYAAALCAEPYPTKPLRMVVPFSAGGTADIVARLMAEYSGRRLGQQIIVENRPGAGGNIGTDMVAHAAPDGYTLLVCSIGTCAINAAMYEHTGYDIERDFAPVILVGGVINVLVVHPSVAARSVHELVALAKARPGVLTYGSSGYGSSPHLCGELLKSMADIDMVHVPYKGSAPAIADLRSAQIQIFFDNTPSILPHVRSGAVRALATTGTQRSALLPDIPTMEQAGFAQFVIAPWIGVLAPKATPAAIVQRLNDAMNQALRDPAMRQRFTELGIDIYGGTAQRLGDYIRSESDKWGKLVRSRNIRAQ